MEKCYAILFKNFQHRKVKKKVTVGRTLSVSHMFLQGLHNRWTHAREELFHNFNFTLWLNAHRKQQTNQQQKNIKNIDQSNEHISDSKQANYNPVAKRWGRKYVSKITEKMSLPKQYIKICNSYKV